MIAMIQRRPVFWSVICLGGILFVVQVSMGWLAYRERTAVMGEIQQILRAREAMENLEPAPTEARLAALRVESARTGADLQALRALLLESLAPLAPPRDLRADDLYFELIAFVERMREEAASAGVDLASSEQFGFQRFIEAHRILLPGKETSPDSKRVVNRVHLQKQVIEALLQGLFAANPVALKAVRREPVMRISSAGRTLPAGLFRMGTRGKRALPEGVESTGFKIIFAGRTAALRRFLHEIAELPLPVGVRSVSVSRPQQRGSDLLAGPDHPGAVSGWQARSALLGASIARQQAPTSAVDSGAVPIVEAKNSVFSVVVYLYIGTSSPAEPDRPIPSTDGRLVWAPPRSQSSGSDWIFEVFTPPTIYFDPAEKAFTVTPPLAAVEEDPFGLELLEVARELYRLQYAGHAGGRNHYLIELVDPATGAFFRGKVGDVFPEAAFAIEAFSVERQTVRPPDPDGTPYIQNTVRLIVADWRLHKSIELTSAPRYEKRLAVVVRADNGDSHRLSVGESLTLQDMEYVLVRADLKAGKARLRRRNSATGTTVTMTLTRAPPTDIP